MLYAETSALRQIASLEKKVRGIQGGTSAGKTIAALLFLIAMAQTDDEPTLTSVVSETTPHLKRGALRDFKNILKAHKHWKEANWNATDSIYTFETGSQIEFFSTDNGDKLRGGRRDRGFMNEANNCSFDAFEQFEVRTREFVMLDWNPTNEFWFYTEVQGQRDDVDHIILTYLDNEALSPEIIASIEQRKHRTQWWRVYGLGQLGEVEGRIYTGWAEIEEVPHEAKLTRRGLDLGYTNDPTALVAIYEWNGGLIFDEELFRKGMKNKPIADVILAQDEQVLVICDSAEPKSIDEMADYGVMIAPSTKGPGSVMQGISVVQDQRVFYTKRSTNIRKEYNNYLFNRDKEGRYINQPEEGFDHSMDAIRYAVTDIISGRKAANDTTVSDFYERIASKGARSRSKPRGAAR
jgi:phage terminase large subunit